MNTASGIILIGLSIILVVLIKSYSAVPNRELKRRSRSGDQTAKKLYRAASYGHSLKMFLWGLLLLNSAFLFRYLALNNTLWFALAATIAAIWLTYIWLPRRRISALGLWLGLLFAPLLAWTMNYLHSSLDWLLRKTGRWLWSTPHTGLYDRDDLIELFELQKSQVDNRIDKMELTIAKNALVFGQKPVSQIITPRKAVKTVNIDDTLGPVILNELHDSGFSRFPVTDSTKQQIIGTLYLHDLNLTSGEAKVSRLLKKDVQYINQDQNLYEALQLMINSHHQLLIVVNGFDEYIGVISLEDVLEQIIGRPIIDEDDQVPENDQGNTGEQLQPINENNK